MRKQETTDNDLKNAKVIWDYHLMGHPLVKCDVAIGLGSHDLGVAVRATELYHDGMFKLLVFSGANSPTTSTVFPRGEAVHMAEWAEEHGVPASAIRVEPNARNTSENIALSRDLLVRENATPKSVMLVCKPYMQRRAYATCRKVWPDVDVVCASEVLTLAEYTEQIGDAKFVIDMLVGDLQRVDIYARKGYAVHQEIPRNVAQAYHRLVKRGYDSRLVL